MNLEKSVVKLPTTNLLLLSLSARSRRGVIEDIYECYASLPTELLTQEIRFAAHPKSKDRINKLHDSLYAVTYGMQDTDKRLRNLIKDGLDKDLFRKVTKQPDKGMLGWIFDSNI